MRVASVVARQLLDCKPRPLVEVEITTNTGHVGRGASPTGTSVGVPLGKYWRSRPLDAPMFVKSLLVRWRRGLRIP